MRRRGGVAELLALVLVTAPSLAAPEPAPEPIAIIVSREWKGIETVSIATLRRLYLGRTATLAGRRVERLHLQSGSRAREGFSQSVMGKPEAALVEYWLEQALTGGPVPPRELASPQAMIEQVRKHPASIGYVSRPVLGTADPPGLRVLRIGRGSQATLPGVPGYPIREP